MTSNSNCAVARMGHLYLAPTVNVGTKMTTLKKTKFTLSDNQTNIDKYRVVAIITEYHGLKPV